MNALKYHTHNKKQNSMDYCKSSTVQTKMLCENVSLRLNKNTVSKPDTFYECLEIELYCSKQVYYS